MIYILFLFLVQSPFKTNAISIFPLPITLLDEELQNHRKSMGENYLSTDRALPVGLGDIQAMRP